MTTNTQNMQSLIHPELSFKLVGVCFNAHNELGPYAREKQYGDFIEKELQKHNLPYKRELKISDGGNILDFLVDEKVVLELKAKITLTQEDYRQIQNYLQVSLIKLGLLVNFRQKYLRPTRIVRIDDYKNQKSGISSH